VKGTLTPILSRGRVQAFAWLALALASIALSTAAGTPVQSTGTANALEDAIANAIMLEHTYPDVPDDTDPAEAYAIQASVVDGVFGKKIVGYKAGLTSTAAQRQFGVDQPVLGMLPEADRLSPKATIAMAQGLKIEVEIGFLVGVEDQPAAMFGVIELPRLAYADMQQVKLADIVATNVSAYRFITGPTAMPDPDVRKYAVSLDRDGAQLFSAFASDAFGDPYNVYGWMVTRIRSLGYFLEPGMILITGSLGRVVDAQPGDYVARYGPLGEIRFRIGANTTPG
jgi:2-keto-4-pentenoate hydratase